MSSTNLKGKAISGVIWIVIQKYSFMFISLMSAIILARLLEPEDYGCIGMLAIFISLAEVFIDAGFGSALIQKKNPTQTDYSTIFFLNIVFSVLIYALLYFSAPVIADFYQMPILCSVLRVQGILLLLYALNIIQLNQLKKKLQFKVIAIANVIASLIGFVVAMILAYNHYGVWALVAQYLIFAAIPTIIYWCTNKWIPKFKFSIKSVKELFNFGGFMLLSSILNKIGSQINGLLIGKMYTPAIMGYFYKAQSTEDLASRSISGVLSQITFPLYAAKQDDKKELIIIIKRLTMTVSYITTPMLVLLSLLAKPVFIILYSEKWLPCVPYFQMLCFAGIAVCLHAVNSQALAAIGKSRVMFNWTVIKKIVEIFLIIIGIIVQGIYGLLFAMIINNFFIYIVNAYNVSKFIGYPIKKQLESILPIFVVNCVAYIITIFVTNSYNLSLYTDGIIKLLIFLSIYIGWSLYFKPESFTYFMSIVKSVIKNKY